MKLKGTKVLSDKNKVIAENINGDWVSKDDSVSIFTILDFSEGLSLLVAPTLRFVLFCQHLCFSC